jgi:peptidoglycan/LPS O-acetylase OafA/YrhL
MRITSESSVNQEIQVLRAIAILTVIVHHLEGLFFWDTTKWARPGHGLWIGVDLFFCISGFVIAKNLLPKLEGKTGAEFWKEVGAFWLRRLYRITPSAWLWLLIPILLSPLMVHTHSAQLGSANKADIISAVLHVANMHFFSCTIGASLCGDFAIYWSLSLEEQFYIALPFTVLIFRKNLSVALIFAFLAQAFVHRIQWVGILSFIRTDAILLGVLVAVFSNTTSYKALDPSLNSSKFRFIIPPVLLYSLFAITRYEIVSFYIGLAALVCGIIVWLCSYNKGYFFKPSFIRDFFVWIGTRSYAIYLIHIPIFWFTHEIWAWIEPEGTVFSDIFVMRFSLTSLVLIVLLAELNYRFIEEPLRKKGKKYAQNMLNRDLTN